VQKLRQNTAAGFCQSADTERLCKFFWPAQLNTSFEFVHPLSARRGGEMYGI
jgi:hypothetical protein